MNETRIANRHRRSLAGLISIAVLLVAGCADSAVEEGQQTGSAESLKVGLLVPQSGVFASLGKEIERGFELYLDANQGRLAGREVQVVKADEGAGPETGKPAVERLIRRDRVDVIVGFLSSAVGLAATPIAAQTKTPAIAVTADTVASPYVWRSSPTANGVARTAGEYLAEEVGDGVYVAGLDYAGGHAYIEAFREGYEGAGAKVAGQLFTPPFGATTDYQPYLSRISDANPKALFVFYAGGDAINFVKQYEQFGLKDNIPLYGLVPLVSDEVLAAQGDSAVGIYSFGGYSTELDNPANEEFVEDFVASYGSKPSPFAVYGFEAALMIDKALEGRDSSDTRNDLLEGLKAIEDLDTPQGGSSFEGDAQRPTESVYLMRIDKQNGELVNEVLRPLGEAD